MALRLISAAEQNTAAHTAVVSTKRTASRIEPVRSDHAEVADATTSQSARQTAITTIGTLLRGIAPMQLPTTISVKSNPATAVKYTAKNAAASTRLVASRSDPTETRSFASEAKVAATPAPNTTAMTF
jgi:hypothetical protein